MRLRHDNEEVKGKPRLNAAEETIPESSNRKRNKLAKFFMETVPATVKNSALVIAFMVGTTVTAHACSGRFDTVGNADGNTDAPADTVDDDTDAPGACPGTYEELEGEVNPLIAKTQTRPLNFNGPEGESVSGEAQVTVGGEISGPLVLGDCPGEAGTVAAFGGAEATVTPSFRIDIPDAHGEFNAVAAESCSAVPDAPPISMKDGEANITVIPAQLGSVPGGAEVGLVNPLNMKVVNPDTGAELSSPIALGDITSIAVITEPSGLTLAAKVLSGEGSELAASEVSAPVSTADSKKLKVFNSSSMLPGIGRWQAQGEPGEGGTVTVCLRPCVPADPFSEIVKEVEIAGLDITGAVSDACGKVFASFDIVSVTAEFDDTVFPYGIDPPHLRGDYSLLAEMHYGNGLDAMSDASPKVYLSVRRQTSSYVDVGELVTMDVAITVIAESRNANPATGEKDRKEFVFNVRLSDPQSGDYYTKCGCTASLPY